MTSQVCCHQVAELQAVSGSSATMLLVMVNWYQLEVKVMAEAVEELEVASQFSAKI